MKPILTLSVITIALLVAGPVFARGDAAAGKEKAQVCFACHGADGNAADPQYPRLAGQWEDYLLQALKEYKSGERDNPIMRGMVATLSEQDMGNLAAFFSSLPGKLDDLSRAVQGKDGR